MFEIKQLKITEDAKRITKFLTSKEAFDMEWMPKEKEYVRNEVFDTLTKENQVYYFIEDNNKRVIAALGIAEFVYGNAVYYLKYFAVDEKYRNKGFGTKLLEKVENFAKNRKARLITVETTDSKFFVSAQTFYEKHGYTKSGLIPDFYEEGEGRIDYYKKL